jgi:hypothetical protein
MENNKIIKKELYDSIKYGISMFSFDRVAIVGEQTIQLEDGRIVEQFLYNIIGHAPKNGNLFVSLKGNIVLE